MLLSVESPGIEDLRTQARDVRVARWSCGCASFNIEVDRTVAPQSQITKRPAVEAFSEQREDPQETFDLLLWVENGWLSGVEIVDYVDRHGDESPDEIPPPEAWCEPTVRP
jgi:hypothetical protein